MKIKSRILLLLLPLLILITGHAQKSYILLSKKTGKINQSVIATLSPSLKGLAALYSAMGGTNCMELHCELTTFLGLGNQGSDAHKQLIEKYFPDDKAAKLVIGQDCYQPPNSSASFSNFISLSFIVMGDEIQVNYELEVFNHGTVKKIKGPDIYTLKNQVFKNKSRVLYAWTGK